MYIFSNLILKRQHPLSVHISCSRDEVFLIGILTCELVSDQVAAVVHISAVLIVILLILPSCRRHLTAALPLFRWHGLFPDAGFRPAAPAELIQLAIVLKCHG